MELFLIITAIVSGYVASIYSWPWIRTQAKGVTAEAASLREKARALDAKIRGL